MSEKAKVLSVLKAYLRPYQRAFVEDQSQRIFVLKSRRIGFSQAAVVKAILIAVTRGTDVYFCSTSMDNSKELIRRASAFIRALQGAGLDLRAEHLAKSIEFPNGSRIIAMPPEKVRGREGTIILDEFSYYVRDREVWAAIAPTADTDASLQIIIIGTPFGASGMYHTIYKDQIDEVFEHGHWSVYNIDVYQAAAEGFPVDPEELRKKYPRDTFLQEFCCKFLDTIDQYFEYDLLRAIQMPEGVSMPEDAYLYAGIDLASKQDGSALARLVDDSECYQVPNVHTLKEAGETRDYTPQFKEAAAILDEDAYDGICVDATGEGAEFGQNLSRRYGKHVVEQIKGANWAVVYECIPQMRLDMERRQFWLPREPRVLSAFAKIQRKDTTKGPKFVATRDSDGHADEFSAVLLAYYFARQRRELRKAKSPTETLGKLPTRASSLGKF